MVGAQGEGSQDVIFPPDFLVIPEDGAKPYLLGSRCEKCGKWWFPRLAVCPGCRSEEVVPRPLSRVGRLYTYTVIRVPQPGMVPPVVVGYVDFPEEVRVGAQIEVAPERIGEIGIGMELEVSAGVVRLDEKGNRVISYRFVPAAKQFGEG